MIACGCSSEVCRRFGCQASKGVIDYPGIPEIVRRQMHLLEMSAADVNPKEQSTMSEHETQLRLECLRLACGIASSIVEAEAGNPVSTVYRAQRYYDFITGANHTGLAEEAKMA